jgi:hypothetical protein
MTAAAAWPALVFIDKCSRHTRYGYTCITLIASICPVTYKTAFVEIPVEYGLL